MTLHAFNPARIPGQSLSKGRIEAVTINSSGQMSFSKALRKKYKLVNENKYAILYFDDEHESIGVLFLKEETEITVPVKDNGGSGAYINGSGLMKTFNIVPPMLGTKYREDNPHEQPHNSERGHERILMIQYPKYRKKIVHIR